MIIAREMYRDPRVILAVQPTRGLDVGAIEFVHQQLVAQRDAGKAVLVVSFELDEILDLSDRILVLYQGKLWASSPRALSTAVHAGLADGWPQLDEQEPANAAA